MCRPSPIIYHSNCPLLSYLLGVFYSMSSIALFITYTVFLKCSFTCPGAFSYTIIFILHFSLESSFFQGNYPELSDWLKLYYMSPYIIYTEMCLYMSLTLFSRVIILLCRQKVKFILKHRATLGKSEIMTTDII